jgi:hypothetical protein
LSATVSKERIAALGDIFAESGGILAGIGRSDLPIRRDLVIAQLDELARSLESVLRSMRGQDEPTTLRIVREEEEA